MPRTDPIAALVALGFTALEAEIYTLLVRESPVTGYRVAQALGKAAANVYKAIESLERKGAVMVDDAGTRLCRPVPVHELLARLGRHFEESRLRAARAIDVISPADTDDRVYRLRSRDQVIERASTMIAGATTVVLADVFPEPFPEVHDALAAAAARGVDVAVQIYGPGTVDGADVTKHAMAERILTSWPGEQINVVADASACLLALLERGGDRVLQAVWTESTYLSCLVHSTVAADHTCARLASGIAADASAAELRHVIASRRLLISEENPGYRLLLARYGERAITNENRSKTR